jgi:hypothetical protein
VREQMKKYLRHEQGCACGWWPWRDLDVDVCNCGLSTLLAALQAHPPAAPTLKLMDSGELHDCTPREFQRWIRKCADAVAIRSDSEAAVIGLAADAIDALLAAPSPAVSVGERAQEQEKQS